MKRRIETENAEYSVDMHVQHELVDFQISGDSAHQGQLLITEVSPGLYSVLREGHSYVVRVRPTDDAIETLVNGVRREFRVSDPRDRASNSSRAHAKGPQEVHAPMPGKVVKLLVKEGDQVSSGSGLIVVEAMKMQNEMKAAKDGRVARVLVAEGATVTPGDILLIIE